MKIAMISPSKVHLNEMTQVLQGPMPQALQGGVHEVVQVEGGRSRLAEVVRDHDPDLVLVDGMGRDPEELVPVEQITADHPQLAVLMLCAQQSPEFLLRAMRAGVREVLPSPPAPASLLMAVDRVAQRSQVSGRHRRGRLLAFLACKGGSGATFIASNLAYQLATDASVLLIDLNLQFGDALSLLREAPASLNLADVARDIDRLDAAFLSACTTRLSDRLSVLSAPEELAESMEVRPEHLEAIVRLALRHYDFVLMDLERHLDPLTLRAMDLADQVFVVMQAGLPSVRHARRLQQVFKGLAYAPEKIGWILNRYERGSEVGTQDIERTLGVQTLRLVANAYRDVSASVSSSTPVLELARSSLVTRHLAELARSLSPRSPERRSLIGRLFQRA
jgi:pilus assembly protein CpaE